MLAGGSRSIAPRGRTPSARISPVPASTRRTRSLPVGIELRDQLSELEIDLLVALVGLDLDADSDGAEALHQSSSLWQWTRGPCSTSEAASFSRSFADQVAEVWPRSGDSTL